MTVIDFPNTRVSGNGSLVLKNDLIDEAIDLIRRSSKARDTVFSHSDHTNWRDLKAFNLKTNADRNPLNEGAVTEIINDSTMLRTPLGLTEEAVRRHVDAERFPELAQLSGQQMFEMLKGKREHEATREALQEITLFDLALKYGGYNNGFKDRAEEAIDSAFDMAGISLNLGAKTALRESEVQK